MQWRPPHSVSNFGVPTDGQEIFEDLAMAIDGCPMGGVLILRGQIGQGTVFYEQCDYIQMAAVRRIVQRHEAAFVGRINVGTALAKQLQGLTMTELGRRMQWRNPAPVAHIDESAMFEQHGDNGCAPRRGCFVQRCLVSRVYDRYVGPVLEQERDDRRIAPQRRSAAACSGV